MADRPQVDSAALLAVVLNLVAKVPETSRLTGLTELHARVRRCPVEFPKPSLPVPMLPCVEVGCARCLGLTGGYSYRWRHIAWVKPYDEARRTGSVPLEMVPGVVTGSYELLLTAIKFDRDVGDCPVPRSLPTRSELMDKDESTRAALSAMPLEAYHALDRDLSGSDAEEEARWLAGHDWRIVSWMKCFTTYISNFWTWWNGEKLVLKVDNDRQKFLNERYSVKRVSHSEQFSINLWKVFNFVTSVALKLCEWVSVESGIQFMPWCQWCWCPGCHAF